LSALAEAALSLAGRGLPVFPLHSVREFAPGKFVCTCGKLGCGNAGKHPYGSLAPNGLKNATTTAATIAEWWHIMPEANVGLATGDIVVLDVDPPKGGNASLATLEQTNGALPTTWQVRTGSGGRHFYFRPPAGVDIRNSSGRIAPGLDIRGAGGYVVAPPSRHVSGGYYEWIVDPDGPLVEPPTWLAALIRRPSFMEGVASDWRGVAGFVGEGARNTTLARIAGHLLRRYVDPHLVLDLAHAWNEARCLPPLPAEEVTITVNSICRRELQRRRTAA
jgi:hypothetical protein